MGMSGTRAGRVSRAGLCSLAAGAAALAMTACGSQLAATAGATRPASASPAAGAGVGSGAALCSRVRAVTRLAVSRVSALPGSHPHFAFPAGVTVANPAAARAVARAVCTLPHMPARPMSCPMDRGISYRLSFAAGRASFPVVTAAAGGCAPVNGAGPVRQAASPGFWTVLAHAMGIRHSASSALQGKGMAG